MLFTSNDISQTSVPDQNVISYIQIKYPHNLNFESTTKFQFSIEAGSGGMQLLQFTNFNSSNNEDIVLYDLTENYRIKVTKDEEVFKAVRSELVRHLSRH